VRAPGADGERGHAGGRRFAREGGPGGPAGAGEGRGDRAGGERGGGRAGGRGGYDRGRGGRGDGPREERKDPGFVRAAQTRRDGMVVGGGERKRGGGRGGGGFSGGGGFGGRGGKPGSDRGPRERDEYDPQAIREASKSAAFRPFASFFKKTEGEGPAEG
jgi:hypothetical protein